MAKRSNQKITTHKQTDTDQKKSESNYKALFNGINDAVFVHPFESKGFANFIQVNDSACKRLGYTRKELLNLSPKDISAPEDARVRASKKGREKLVKDKWMVFEAVHISKSGQQIPVEISSKIFDIDGTVAIMSLARDITERLLAEQERKQSERRINHLNRVLQAIRNVNQLITKEKDRDRLLKGACENLIETRGYYNAWIALLDKSGKYITAEAAGWDQDFSLLSTMFKSEKTSECVKIALKQSDVIIFKDPSIHCKGCPLSDKYPEGAGRMTIRLEYEGEFFGIMTVSIPKELINDKEEHSLLKEVAGDIAFALYNIRAEKKRQLAEEHNRFLSSVVEQSADGMAIADMNGNLLFSNIKWANMHGYEKTEILTGKKLSIFHNKKQLKDDVEPFNRKVMEKGFYKGEVGHKRKDGSVFPTQMTTTLLKDKNNNPVAIAGVATDITARKKADEALRKSESRYRLLFNLLPYGGEVINTKGIIEQCSPSTAQMLGYDVSELVGLHITKLLDPDSINVFREKYPQLLSGQPATAEICMICKDGSKLNILRAAQPIINNKGIVEAILALNVDITERKQAEEDLLKSENNLRTLFNAMTDIVIEMDSDGRYINI
ncbi:MAG: hypothetical protein DRJ05_20010, partial [Bacteroidetes bacterium]